MAHQFIAESCMLAVNELFCERDQRVLFSGLSIKVDRGEILKVSGDNGCGKTTLLRIFMGLFPFYEGDVSWETTIAPLYLGHLPGVKDSLTVLENLLWLCQLQGELPAMAQIEQALMTLRLAGYEDAACGSLSEGQRKKVNLARFFLLHNPCWILDEPFSSLDSAGILSLSDRMQQPVAGGGMIVLTSHQPLPMPVRELELGR